MAWTTRCPVGVAARGPGPGASDRLPPRRDPDDKSSGPPDFTQDDHADLQLRTLAGSGYHVIIHAHGPCGRSRRLDVLAGLESATGLKNREVGDAQVEDVGRTSDDGRGLDRRGVGPGGPGGPAAFVDPLRARRGASARRAATGRGSSASPARSGPRPFSISPESSPADDAVSRGKKVNRVMVVLSGRLPRLALDDGEPAPRAPTRPLLPSACRSRGCRAADPDRHPRRDGRRLGSAHVRVAFGQTARMGTGGDATPVDLPLEFRVGDVVNVRLGPMTLRVRTVRRGAVCSGAASCQGRSPSRRRGRRGASSAGAPAVRRARSGCVRWARPASRSGGPYDAGRNRTWPGVSPPSRSRASLGPARGSRVIPKPISPSQEGIPMRARIIRWASSLRLATLAAVRAMIATRWQLAGARAPTTSLGPGLHGPQLRSRRSPPFSSRAATSIFCPSPLVRSTTRRRRSSATSGTPTGGNPARRPLSRPASSRGLVRL